MSVGDNIKRRRFERKMSQQELADAMGYKTRTTIAKIEAGINDVSQKKLQKFAEVLEVPVESLITGLSAPQIPTEQTASPLVGNKNVVIILAGGKSGRNRQNIPSQFLSVNSRPILTYSMTAYEKHPLINEIYVVCLKGWESIVRAYAKEYGITKLRGIFLGGTCGILSLKNGLDAIRDRMHKDDLVLIQESTRPHVTPEIISRLIQVLEEKKSATVCHSMNDYVQFDVSGDTPKYVNRDSTLALQSPEAHRFSVLNEVFEKAEKEGHLLNESCFTMLMYHLGYEINFIKSSVNNIKIAREEDLAAFATKIKEEMAPFS